jgi:short-subunit dehydrogenase
VGLPAPSPTSTALITGCSSGLGVDLARAVAKRGHNVVLVARREDRLKTLAAELAGAHGVRADVIASDLGETGARDDLVAKVEALGLTVELLVNNAGYGSGGRFVERDRDTEVAMVRLNCEAVVDLCARYAPAMADRGRGGIINVASTVSFQPVVRQATYSATKHMVRAFSEALHEELRGAGVHVCCLCPGPMKTEFIDVAEVGDAADNAPDFIYETPADMAEAGLEGLERNRRIVMVGAVNRIGAVAGAHTPHAPMLRLMNRFYPIGR